MSFSDQPPASAPPGLRKSLSGQNLAGKANQDLQGETQEVAVQGPVVEEGKGKEVVTSSVDGAGDVDGPSIDKTETTGANDEGKVPNTPETHATEPHDKEKQKVTGLQRLKSGLAKFSKGGHRGATSDHAVQTPADTNAEVADANAGEGIDATGEGAAQEDDVDIISDDPTVLADVIRDLVQLLPQPTESVPVPSKPKLPQLDASGKPIPPTGAVLTDNKLLITKLRNPVVMNGKAGDASEGEEVPTVFAILDSFKAPSSAPGNSGTSKEGSNVTDDGDDDAGGDDIGEGSDDGQVEPPHTIADDSSIMVYIPLIPTKKSKVEMAKFQIVPINSKFKQTAQENIGADESKFVEMLSTYRAFGTFGRGTVPPVIIEDGASGGKVKETAIYFPKSRTLWPWKKKTPVTAPPASQPPTSSPDTDTKAPESGSGDADEKPIDGKKPADGDKDKKKLKKPKPTLEQRVWIPSNTNVSIQALWWGYRMFLPPPVMAILSDKTLEAAKRASMITNALTWFFLHLPLTMFPAPMQPVLLLLQQIIPFVGYIGTFVTWSWTMIKSYDVGYGVILSATWILPVALIPGTWQAYDFPGPSNPGKTPSQPSTPNTPVVQPPPGTPSPPTGTPAQPPTNGAPQPNAPISIDIEPEPTTSTRLRLVKGNDDVAPTNGLPPTVSKRLALVKGQVMSVLSPDPDEVVEPELSTRTYSKRLALVKGKGEDINAPEKDNEAVNSKKAGGGIRKFFKGGPSKDSV